MTAPPRRVLRLPSRRLLAAGACALAAAAAAAAFGGARAPVEAREYNPATTPKASYVAPLAPWPGPSYRAKDFAIVEKGGLFHLFYTRLRRHSPFHEGVGANQVLNETCLGHAVSSDLEHWTELDTILSVRPGQWDEHHVWAPTVALQNNVAYLFYGGVRDTQTTASPTSWTPRFQAIGMAMASDPTLGVWFRMGPAVWQPCAGGGLPGVPWALCVPNPLIGTADFRDPFVLEPDPAVIGSPFSLYYTARVRTDQWNYVVGVAQTSSPFGNWSDAGALWETHDPATNSKVESPHVLRRNGQHHLFFSGDDETNGLMWMTSLGSPLGPWTSHGSLRAIFGPNTLDPSYSFKLEVEHWFASEHLRRSSPSGTLDYFCVVHAYDGPAAYNPPGGPSEDISAIEFRSMLWRPDGTFTFAAPNPVRAAAWTANASRTGSIVKLRLTVEGAAGRSADLATSVVRNGVETVVSPASVGLPASVVLVDGVTEVPWTVPSFGTWLPLTFKVKVANQPLATTAFLHLTSWGANTQGEAEMVTDPPIVRPISDGAPDALAQPGIAPGALELALRRLPESSGGSGGYAFAIELPGAGRARLELFDVRGRRVRVAYDDVAPAGRTLARWDGRDERGVTAPHGVYFARLTSPFGDRSLRVLHVRS